LKGIGEKKGKIEMVESNSKRRTWDWKVR